MGLVLVNDPVFGDLPAVGETPGVIAERMRSGLAVVWDPKTGDAGALAAFLGDDFVSFEGTVYARRAGGRLDPVDWSRQAVVVVRPPAGDIFTLGEPELKSAFARVADGLGVPVVVEEEPVVSDPLAVAVAEKADAPADIDGDGVIDVYEAQTVLELQDVLRERGLAVSGAKAELVARLHEDDAATKPAG